MNNLIDFPAIIEPSIKMTEANQEFLIYEGDIVLKLRKEEMHVDGLMQYKWFPEMGVYFSGTTQKDNIKLVQDFSREELVVIINGLNFGGGFLTFHSFSSSTEVVILGGICKDAVIGDKSVPVEYVRFSIPNMRFFHGLPVIKKLEKQEITSTSRLILDSPEYSIKIDGDYNYKQLSESLYSKGGYLILHGGEIRKKRGSLLFSDVSDISKCLNLFVSFLNGRSTSGLFYKGIFENDEKWIDYTAYPVQINKAVISWPQKVSIKGINEAWNKFCTLWKDPDNRTFLTAVVQWYLYVNSNEGIVDGSIILAQTALELIYNWLVIERRKIIIGKDSENISASNKIRLLLSQLKLDGEIPIAFTELESYRISAKNIDDGPEAIVQIRNAIVHSQFEKRKSLASINLMARYQALQLSIWYIELSLLHILEYNGKYHNRCAGSIYPIDSEKTVPWKN